MTLVYLLGFVLFLALGLYVAKTPGEAALALGVAVIWPVAAVLALGFTILNDGFGFGPV